MSYRLSRVRRRRRRDVPPMGSPSRGPATGTRTDGCFPSGGDRQPTWSDDLSRPPEPSWPQGERAHNHPFGSVHGGVDSLKQHFSVRRAWLPAVCVRACLTWCISRASCSRSGRLRVRGRPRNGFPSVRIGR